MTDWWLTAQQAVTEHGALQDPHELAVLLTLLAAREPRSVLEIGTWAGGLTWALGELPGIKQIVTVDRDPLPLADVVVSGLACDAVALAGSSYDLATANAVTRALDDAQCDVLVIDGDHAYLPARTDWELYRPLVMPGGLAVIHDTQGYPGNPGVEVPRLWAEIRKDYVTIELVSRPGGPYGTGIVWP